MEGWRRVGKRGGDNNEFDDPTNEQRGRRRSEKGKSSSGAKRRGVANAGNADT